MSGKFLGRDVPIFPHECRTPRILFRKTYTVWQCECGKKHRLEWEHWPGDSYRTWVEYVDPVEAGYNLLAKDPEMIRGGRKEHHHGFDFMLDSPTANCSCGAVMTNPFYRIGGGSK